MRGLGLGDEELECFITQGRRSVAGQRQHVRPGGRGISADQHRLPASGYGTGSQTAARSGFIDPQINTRRRFPFCPKSGYAAPPTRRQEITRRKVSLIRDPVAALIVLVFFSIPDTDDLFTSLEDLIVFTRYEQRRYDLCGACCRP